MSVSKNEYSKMAKRASPSSPILTDCLKAFLVGGAICCLSQGILEVFTSSGVSEDTAKKLVLIILIVITAVLTATGVFDNIAKHAGAGTAVPITGFANSIVSPAIESKSEGFILGTAAKMFSIAGPVIVFGCSSAALYGLIYYIVTKFFMS